MDSQQPGQPTPAPSTQAKWWPINWRHNIFLKIAGSICLFCFFLFCLFVLILIFLGIYGKIKPLDIFNFIPTAQIFVELFGSISLIHFLISVILFNKLDKFDKMLLSLPILFIFAYALVFLFSPICC
jgi:hypothetical protein